MARSHLWIPDSQVKPNRNGVEFPLDFLDWIGALIAERRPDVIVHLGDFADMESLSSFDVGKKDFEGRRYVADIAAANEAFARLCKPLDDYNATRRAWRERLYLPERHLLLGNHEARITRAVENDAKLDGVLSTDDLRYADHGWTVHPFLVPITIDGVSFAHYWANPMNGRPYGGTALTMLKTLGRSFVQGHKQTLDYAMRFVGPDAPAQHGLIAGSAYLHREAYLGPQGNDHFRGVIWADQVEGGSYDPQFISLGQLCRKFQGTTLERFMARRY